MENTFLSWEEEWRNNFIEYFLSDSFHAVNFYYNEIRYILSGWWVMEAVFPDGTERCWDAESKDELLHIKAFDNDSKTIFDVKDDFYRIDFQFVE